MKRLLLSLTVLFTTLCVSASEYIYTSTGRYRVEKEMTVVQPGTGWNNYSSSLYSVYTAETEDDFNGIQSLTSDEGMFISNAFKLEDTGRSYVVTFSFFSLESGNSSITNGSMDQIDAWISSQDDKGVRTGTEGVEFQQVASTFTYTAGEWTTVSWFFTDDLPQDGSGNYLNILFSRIDADAIIASNLKITQVKEVYDTRIAQKQLDFICQLMADPNFDTEAAQEAKDELETYVDAVQEAIYDNNSSFDEIEEATNNINELNEYLEAFLAVESSNLTKNDYLPSIDIESIAAYGRGRLTAIGCLTLDGGNWGHITDNDESKKILRSAIQNGYAHSATLKIASTTFPAGKYFFSAEIRNANTAKDSWPCTPTYNLSTECDMWVGDTKTTLDPISGQDFQKFYIVGDVTADGTFEAGVYWPGTSNGGLFEIRNLQVRSFVDGVADKIARVNAWASFIAQWNVLIGARTSMIARGTDPEYPWGRDTISITQKEWDPIYEKYYKIWVDDDGNDLGVADTTDLKAFGDGSYQGYTPTEEEKENNSWKTKFALVRAYQYANNYLAAHNKPIADLKSGIADAEATRDDAMNVAGDKGTYQTAIDAAKNLFNDILEKTTDATMEADTASINKQLAALADAKEVFLKSSEIEPIVDIDFSKGWTPVYDPEEEDHLIDYVIKGEKGEMTFASLAAVNTDNSVGGNEYQLGYQGTNEDVLRVGKFEATVEFEAPTDDEVVRVEFDVFFGKLSNRYINVDLRNAENNTMAGFSFNRYDAKLAYNHFNNASGNSNDTGEIWGGGTGLDIVNYVSNISNVNNNEILVESNRHHFTLVLDYKAQSLQGSMTANGNTVNGAPVPMLNVSYDTSIEDNKVVKFVLGSNYDNADRRCWFDNLVIKKYASSAEGFAWTVIDAPTSATAATPVAYYTLSGAQTTAAQKGIVIVKYSDGSVKKIYNK